MRKSVLAVILAFACRPALAQVATPPASQVYSAVQQFSPQNNANGAWSYGYTQTLGSPFILYTISGATCCSGQIGWFGPFGPAPGYPLVLENQFVPTQALDMDPGPNGEYSVVRWTAPSGGSWDIVGDFFGTGVTTTDVHVLKNSAPVYDNVVNASEIHNFGLTLTLQKGETIDFAVGFGDAFGGDPTGFQAVVSPHQYGFTTLDFPEAASTQIFGVNGRGDVVGQYVDTQGNTHGFSYNKTLGFKTIDVPGAVQSGAFGIDDTGRIVGFSVDALGAQHGFLLVGSNFIPICPPGAVDTNALGINAKGDIVGVFDTGDVSTQIGFLLRQGQYTIIQDPVAAPQHTQVDDVNDKGQIVGTYEDSDGNLHGLLLENGKFTTSDFPDADSTVAWGVNSQGQVVGRYLRGPGGNQSYVLFKGSFEPVVFPGAVATAAHGINEAGQLVGFYRGVGGGPLHGFIAQPGQTGNH
jgi:hypothetical protein